MALKAFYITAMVITLAMLGTSLFSRRTELTKRCITLVVLINLVCLILLLGRISFIVLMLAVAATGAFELALCAQMNNYEKSLMIISSTVLFILFKLFSAWFFYMLTLGLIMSFLLLWSKFSFNNKRHIAWGSLICIVIPCTVLLTNVYDTGMVHIIAVILLVQFNDGFAYLAGKKLGKTKIGIINWISPNKTLEGYIAGLFGIILAIILLHTIIPVYPGNEVLIRILCLSAAVFVFANLGDLVFSIIKRRLEVKDFSNLLAGHGGILDRFDSILYLAPVYLYLLSVGVI